MNNGSLYSDFYNTDGLAILCKAI